MMLCDAPVIEKKSRFLTLILKYICSRVYSQHLETWLTCEMCSIKVWWMNDQCKNKTKQKKQKVGWKGKQNRKVLGGQIPEKNQPEI